MLYKFLRFTFHLLKHPSYWLDIQRKRYFNFIFPNFNYLFSKRLNFEKYPTCNQKTLLTGAGRVELGKNIVFGYKPGGFHRGGCIEIQPRSKQAVIKIGNNVATNNNLFLCSANYIEIGDNTLIGQYVTIMDFEAHGIDPEKRREIGVIGKVVIGKNVWIGNNVTILKNTIIGDNSIVAAGAVVSGRFPKM